MRRPLTRSDGHRVSAIRSAACARTARTGSDGEVRHEAIDGSSLGGERDSGGVRDGR